MELNHACFIAGVFLFVVGLTAFAQAGAPFLSIPSAEKSCYSDLNRFIDLRNFTLDSDVNSVSYSVTAQSNRGAMDCQIDGGYFVSCEPVSCSNDFSLISIKAVDSFGYVSNDYFKLTLRDYSPEWKNIPSQCINESKSRFIDLRDYAFDVEDKNALEFSLTQNNISGIDCFVEDGHFLSCSVSTNKQVSSSLNIAAEDSRGNVSSAFFSISANCFDKSGNDSNALGGIVFEADNKGVCLENCTSYSALIKLQNNSNQSKCFSFDAVSNPDYLPVSLTPDNICLGPNQSSFLTLSVNTCGALERSYKVRVFAEDTNLELFFDFRVGGCNGFGGFLIKEFDGVVCRGGDKQIPVIVRNTSPNAKKIFLSAENSIVLPYFDREYVYLESGQEKEVWLNINAANLPLGLQGITISGDAGDFHIEKRLSVDVTDCSSVVERTFSLSAPKVCFDVKRGSEIDSWFSITRQSEPGDECFYNSKDFFFSANGFPAQFSFDSVSLLANASRVIPFSVMIPSDASAGKHYFYLTARDGANWDSFSETKSICFNVLGENNVGFNVNTPSMDIPIGETGVFEVEAVNNGDFDANYSVSVIGSPRGVNVNLSVNKILIPKGVSKKFFVAVSPQILAQVSDNQRVVLRLVGPLDVTAFIHFNIVPGSFLESLEILSASKKINMKSDSSAEYSIIFRNNTTLDLNNVKIYFENVPSDVNIEGFMLDSLSAGKSASVFGKIIAGDTNGVFKPAFVVVAGDFINKREFDLEITKSEEAALFGWFGAFFGFGELTFDSLFTAILMAILLIVFIALIIKAVIVLAKKSSEKKEAWMK